MKGKPRNTGRAGDGMSKYQAQPAVIDGVRFASKREARRWAELLLLQSAGEITDLRRQVKIGMEGRDGPIRTPTGRKAAYVADFTYVNARNGCLVIEDAKGFPTPEYKLKRAILAAMGLTIKEV